MHSAKHYRGHRNRGHIKRPKSDICSASGDKVVNIVDRGPYISNEMIKVFYVGAIDTTQDSLKIINPYFALSRGIKRALKKVIKRSAKVGIVSSTSGGIPLTLDCGLYNAYKLTKQGANVWMLTDGFHHIRVIMVDGKFCVMGSVSLSVRSLNFDCGENAVTVDRCITR